MSSDSTVLARMVKNMKRTGVDPLRPLLDAYLLERGSSTERFIGEIDMLPRPRPPGRLSPSSLCGCEREAVFRFTGVKGRRRLNPDTELIFDDGNWRHHRWQTTFKDMELVLGPERFEVVSIEERVQYPELYIEGSLDALVKIAGKKWLIDIKGINNAGFSWMVMNDAPVGHHVRQLVAYLRARKVTNGLLWYDNKDNQLTKAYVIRYDDEAWHEVEGWCESVISFMERRRLPPMHAGCKRGTFYYERCAFAGLCFGKKSRKELTAMAYDRFDGVDEVWERHQQ